MLRLEDFLWGFVTGIVFTMLLGRLWTIYRGWVKQASAIRKPLKVDDKTSKTPVQIYREAAVARTKILFLYLLLFILVVFLAQSIWPDQFGSWSTA